MKRLSNAMRIAHPLFAWSGAMLFVILWYVLAQSLLSWLLQVGPASSAYPRDLIAHLLIGTFLFVISRSLTRFALATTALFTALTLGNALKLSILGAPVMPDDFAAARNMLMLLDGWPLIGAILMVAAPLLLLTWAIAWNKTRTWVSLGGLALGLSLLVSFSAPLTQSMDREFGHSVWNQPGNYRSRGLPIHLLQETTRALARRVAPPSKTEVSAALAVLRERTDRSFIKVTDNPKVLSRNLHMIVLESFWDPMLLSASKLSADPLDPDFRQLWSAAGQSHLLSPVFGGYTANTEFEVLCGFPVTQDNVFFESGLKRDAPCLPHHLRDMGYHTVASHPNAASFWNRVNAYRRIGFETYWADRDFALDDMNRSFLSDASLYRQVMERLGPELTGKRPLFDYVLTFFGHLPYPLNEHRPPVISAAEGHSVVADYANTVYYKSRELMAFLRELRQADPDGLIVLFGDHLPALKPNFGGYTESGVLAKRRGDFTDAMFATLVETPLILIDGQRGPIVVGDLPAYQLPSLLLHLLGDQTPTIMDLATQPAREAPIRPLPGVHFTREAATARVCRGTASDADTCQRSQHWVQAVETLRADLFSGEQYTLLELHAPSTELREAAVHSHSQATGRVF